MKKEVFHVKRILCILLSVLFLLPMTCAQADTLALPRDVTEIGKEAFLGDSSLENVTLPDGVKKIGSRAFANSTLKSIRLPASLTSIADDAFSVFTLN